MVDEAEIHRMAKSADVQERKKAASQLGDDFSSFLNKNAAWSDLHRLTQDKNHEVRLKATDALESAFSDIPYKETAWSDLHRLTQDKNEGVRWMAVCALESAFSDIPDKDAAWADLHQLTKDKDSDVRRNVTYVLESVFSDIPDKDAAWADLYKLTLDGDSEMRWVGAGALGRVYSNVPDKDTAWADLQRLTQDENKEVRQIAAFALDYAFSDIPDKDAAWTDLHQLTQDEDSDMRWMGASSLGRVFSDIPDKYTAWADLHRLTQDKNNEVRRNAAYALGHAFLYIIDKDTAWADLHRLTQDKDSDVRRNAAYALGHAFLYIIDKDIAWSDLHRLTQDETKGVRWWVADALGSAFPHISDKDSVWADLQRLTQDEDSDVRMHAYHSLGSASVYKATETENVDKFKEELKKAIGYFEKSSLEAKNTYSNPAQFCLPFYRSYYAVISEKQEAETEAAKYLDEAKNATEGSESREALLEAVENLANALNEAQKPLGFGETKEHLKACRRHCDHTAELANNARSKSPVAAEAIMRGIPIVRIKVKKIIAEIQEKAKKACQESQGTPTEEIACAVNEEVQKWNISDQNGMTQNVENMIFCLQSLIPKTPTNNDLHEKIEEIRLESDVVKQYTMFLMFIPLISTISPKKSWNDIFDSSSTHAAFIGFVTAELGMIFYPTQNTHLISAVVAVYAFFIVAILKSIKKERKLIS